MEKQPRRVDCPVGGLNEQVSHVPALRWKRDETISLAADTGHDVHTIVVILKPSRMTLRHAGQTLFDGSATRGITQVTGPRQRVRATCICSACFICLSMSSDASSRSHDHESR